MDSRLGHWAFIVGILITVIAGLVPAWQTNTVVWILIILGLVVGLLNITAKETVEFLVATIALLAVGSIVTNVQITVSLGDILAAILKNISLFVAPAALVVSLNAIYELARK